MREDNNKKPFIHATKSHQPFFAIVKRFIDYHFRKRIGKNQHSIFKSDSVRFNIAGTARHHHEAEKVETPNREEKLQVRKRGGRKRALGTRKPMLPPSRPNERWSLDFVSDAFMDGRRFRILAVVDDYSRECLALMADTSLSGLRATRELNELIKQRGKPNTIVSDNGIELTSMAVLKWCQETNIEWHYIISFKNGKGRRKPRKSLNL